MRAAMPLALLPLPSGSSAAWRTRQTAYAARPIASNGKRTFPPGSPARLRIAPFGSVVSPPKPSAAWTASPPTSRYTTPFAAWPARASFLNHGRTLRTARGDDDDDDGETMRPLPAELLEQEPCQERCPSDQRRL